MKKRLSMQDKAELAMKVAVKKVIAAHKRPAAPFPSGKTVAQSTSPSVISSCPASPSCKSAVDLMELTRKIQLNLNFSGLKRWLE